MPESSQLSVAPCKAQVAIAGGRIVVVAPTRRGRRVLAAVSLGGVRSDVASLGRTGVQAGEVDLDTTRASFALRNCLGGLTCSAPRCLVRDRFRRSPPRALSPSAAGGRHCAGGPSRCNWSAGAAAPGVRGSFAALGAGGSGSGRPRRSGFVPRDAREASACRSRAARGASSPGSQRPTPRTARLWIFVARHRVVM